LSIFPYRAIIPLKGNEYEIDMSSKAKPDREYLTTLEAEQLSGLSRNYLALLLRRGTLEGFRPSRDWFVYKDSLEKFIKTPRKSGPRGPHNKPKQEQPSTPSST
jgi:hypothetical protein